MENLLLEQHRKEKNRLRGWGHEFYESKGEKREGAAGFKSGLDENCISDNKWISWNYPVPRRNILCHLKSRKTDKYRYGTTTSTHTKQQILQTVSQKVKKHFLSLKINSSTLLQFKHNRFLCHLAPKNDREAIWGWPSSQDASLTQLLFSTTEHRIFHLFVDTYLLLLMHSTNINQSRRCPLHCKWRKCILNDR